MINFFKSRFALATEHEEQLSLGRLELQLMEILWANGECNVRDASQHLDRHLAYTTVMTTLDRLYKKGLLERRMPERAYLYSPRYSREVWERRKASLLMAGLLRRTNHSRELLVSSFLDAVGEHDDALLDELERKIRKKRKELARKGQS
jgi:predicted transcriptional regulator